MKEGKNNGIKEESQIKEKSEMSVLYLLASHVLA